MLGQGGNGPALTCRVGFFDLMHEFLHPSAAGRFIPAHSCLCMACVAVCVPLYHWAYVCDSNWVIMILSVLYIWRLVCNFELYVCSM